MKSVIGTLLMLSFAALAAAQTKISGTSQCAKPDQQQMIEIGDRPGHSFIVSKVACNWAKPMETAGMNDKSYVASISGEIRGEKERLHGYVIDTMENGDQAFVRFEGTGTLKNGVPDTAEGKWSYLRGTGKLKGIKGGGTYTGQGNADGTFTYNVEGEYTLPGK